MHFQSAVLRGLHAGTRLEEVQGAVQKGAEILTNAINELLDEPYQLGKNTDERSRAKRFM